MNRLAGRFVAAFVAMGAFFVLLAVACHRPPAVVDAGGEPDAFAPDVWTAPAPPPQPIVEPPGGRRSGSDYSYIAPPGDAGYLACSNGVGLVAGWCPPSTAATLLPDGGAGGIWYENSDGGVAALPIGTTGQALTAAGGLPSWQTPASLPDGGRGALWYENSDGGVSALPAGTTGQLLEWSDAGLPVAANPYARLTPIDSNTQLYWTFDETTSPWANHGNAGALNMGFVGGAGYVTRTGVFAIAYSAISGSGNSTGTAGTSLGESPTLTVSWWGYIRAYQNYGDFVVKQPANGVAPPGAPVQIQLDNSGNGGMQWIVNVLPGGDGGVAAVNFNGLASYDKPLIDTWYFYALTYDPVAGLLSAYINGNLVGTASASKSNSPINWAGTVTDGGTHGAWTVQGNNTGTENMNCLIDDMRVEGIVRSQAYLQAQYFNGIGWGQ